MITFISLKSFICRTFKPNRSIVPRSLVCKNKRNIIMPRLIALAFALIADQGRACSFNVTAVDFESYNFRNNAALHSTGNIFVNCPSGVGYNIVLGAGSGTFTQRLMGSGAHSLNYNLFTAANRALVWGDATNGSVVVSGSGTGDAINHVVYGRIPPHQNVPAGGYSDTISVMINF
jgi:spore coat protein U-like protein